MAPPPTVHGGTDSPDRTAPSPPGAEEGVRPVDAGVLGGEIWMAGPISVSSALGAALQGQPELRQMMLVVRCHLVELLLERSHAGDAVDELQVSLLLVVPPRVVDDGIANRVIDPPRKVEWHLVVIQAAGPGILIVNPEHLTRFAEDPADTIEQDGFAIGEVVQDVSDRPFARGVAALQIRRGQRVIPQCLVARGLELWDDVHGSWS